MRLLCIVFINISPLKKSLHMLRLISLFFFSFLIQNPDIMAQQIAGHWQNSEGALITLTEEGILKIDNTNGTFYGTWETENDQITLNLFSEYTPYTYAVSDFFEDLTYIGEGYIPETELTTYRNGYQLNPLPAQADDEQTGTVSLDSKWLVSPSRLKGAHVATWQMDDGAQLDLSEWGAFRVFTPNIGTNYGLFEIDDEILRLQFLFQDATYEYDLASLVDKQHIGPSSLTPTEFQQAELEMFNMLYAQVQSTNQMLTQMSSQMLEQMHQTTTKMIINLSGNDWIYEDEDK